jgi:hypothetical protein
MLLIAFPRTFGLCVRKVFRRWRRLSGHMIKNLFDDERICDACDHSQSATTVLALGDFNLEHALETLGPIKGRAWFVVCVQWPWF